MELLKTIFIFLLIQNLNAQTEVELVFWDNCENKIFKKEYEVDNLNNPNEFYSSKDSKVTLPKGKYLVHFGKLDGDLFKSSSQVIEIKDSKKIIDTLIIPKILFATEIAINGKYWNYYNCEKVCNGYQTDFYPNGNLRLEGTFNNGKPLEITEFRENGVRITKTYYKPDTVEILKIEYFDESGKIYEYEIHKFIKGKPKVKVFNGQGKFLRNE